MIQYRKYHISYSDNQKSSIKNKVDREVEASVKNKMLQKKWGRIE
jgi:hypothetical protein